jgi:hypothetical protein
MKTGPDALYSYENESGHTKYKKQDQTPYVPPKTCPGTENMKTGPDALGTAKNMSRSEKHENGIGRPRYLRK